MAFGLWARPTANRPLIGGSHMFLLSARCPSCLWDWPILLSLARKQQTHFRAKGVGLGSPMSRSVACASLTRAQEDRAGAWTRSHNGGSRLWGRAIVPTATSRAWPAPSGFSRGTPSFAGAVGALGFRSQSPPASRWAADGGRRPADCRRDAFCEAQALRGSPAPSSVTREFPWRPSRSRGAWARGALRRPESDMQVLT